ncbi:MAG: bacillithiol biosynthesis cysteine-adding enzyme BshC, partial [Mucilaginibacter sp.]|nr:bacillithiol biosynthesis cysteine-adding enzyme BshC [Mucilaginibacter sp.]
MDAACIDYKDTGYFSQTVIDYLENVPELRSFYSYRPTLEGFAELFENKKVVADRKLLAEVLHSQYFKNHEGTSPTPIKLEAADFIRQKIDLLKSDNTYTVTTGHQLNIFTGPLYFIYKIVTAIKLCRQLKDSFPDKNFVPVYWMAS